MTSSIERSWWAGWKGGALHPPTMCLRWARAQRPASGLSSGGGHGSGSERARDLARAPTPQPARPRSPPSLAPFSLFSRKPRRWAHGVAPPRTLSQQPPFSQKRLLEKAWCTRGAGMETHSRAGTEQRPGDLFLGVPLTVFLRKESLGLMTGPSLVGGGSRHVAVCGPRALTGCSVLCPQLPQSLSPTLTEVTTPPCQPSPAVCRPAPPGASVALAVLPGAAAPRGSGALPGAGCFCDHVSSACFCRPSKRSHLGHRVLEVWVRASLEEKSRSLGWPGPPHVPPSGTYEEPPQKCILKAFCYQTASTICSSLFFLFLKIHQ